MTDDNMKRVPEKICVFYGHFGGYNAGDELILETFQSNYSSNASSIVVCASEPSDDYHPDNTSEVYSYTGFIRNLTKFRNRIFIVSGGQIASGDRNLWSVLKLLLFILAGKLLGNKVLIVGVGFYRLEVFLSKLICSISVCLADYCAVRDAKSLAALCVWAQKKAVLRSDIVFSNSDIVHIAKRPVDRLEEVRTVGIFLHYSKSRSFNSFEYYNALVQMLVDGGMKVQVFCHENRELFDRYYTDSNQEFLRVNGVDVVVFGSSVGELLSMYEEMDLILSARMHPLIVSLLKNIRCVCIGGSSKVHAFAEQAGIPVFGEEDLENNRLDSKVAKRNSSSNEFTESNKKLGQRMLEESLRVIES